ncbi:hypothetical protein [Paenibacillus sp. RC67]|uniref:hypothetical protein n=1 Tax=Paenibacillus sp. RC67 TaxID=3039392 RepID=UPI0024ADCC34|nr:hypothetical protein [Paenibacillus sp. RC67]
MQSDVTVWKDEALIELLHEKMDTKVGYPALLAPEDAYPDVTITINSGGSVTVKIIHLPTGQVVASAMNKHIEANDQTVLSFQEKSALLGAYRVEVELSLEGNATRSEYYYFTLISELPARSSKAAYTNETGAMNYLPDYRGNRLPDFSGVGYRGGGESIPDVPVQIKLVPISGDNTSHIQKAIDQVSQLPLDANGFRGAVLLAKGVYEIASSLEIRVSGVILRGEVREMYVSYGTIRTNVQV